MTAVILCGGRGKRMGDASEKIPKSMTKILGKPVLEHQLDILKREGISDFIFITGYLHEKIFDYFADGKAFGVNIAYYRETSPLGTAGALFKLKLTEDFILINGDLIFDFDLDSMKAFHKKSCALTTLFTHPNTHPYDSTLIEADEKGKITAIIPKHSDKANCRNLCNAGIEIISPKLLEIHNIVGQADLDRDLIAPSVSTDRIFSYKSPEYVYDMGTPERLEKVKHDLEKGIPEKRNKNKPRPAVFLDRDGTINRHIGFITRPEEIEIIEGAAQAIADFNAMGYLVIVVTNQPVIARGECTFTDLEKIHGRLEQLLGEKGAYLDELYFCPHHPDSGFKGEVKELKIDCNCRKPKAGMLLTAQDNFNIDMESSYMVGDSERDVAAGKSAGCKTVYLSEARHSEETDSDLIFPTLMDFATYLKNNKETSYEQ